MQTMNHYTITQIAESESVSKRTVQNWLKLAMAEHGSIGTMIGNARAFTEYEKSILLSYSGGMKVSARTTKPTYETTKLHSETTKFHSETTSPIYETAEIEIIDTQPAQVAPLAIIPTSFDLSALRGCPTSAPAPLAMANDALEKMAALRAAMAADMQLQEAHLNQQKLTVQILDAESAKLQREADDFKRQSEMNALRQELLQAQQANALGKLDAYAQSS